ncbi:hypothetical protein LTR99_003409 [Exophiala xenobiotica]|uniref:Guanine nucleotide exchange factor Vps9 n=1 Tax=Vermiconidia calcicola TaxID=1690605 RepID=A0AAV9PTK4_9PEZI|nr:hypothetical protein LTR96_008281 [Exophiala xenobiotica]KAK5529217.1 hypothetical protein LTR25_009954 [Vermiconidia calcicola]KAK5547182.1 hypothetical protein LTR23_002821 [Chaetothyriales sp. CCFEE 6169]KAK5305865.1 hypothetical protein LTR99_003409 [Exophiala xenobiotica]KAK5335497.1 hypothetical protein LTR98_008497 [Exophiala xenobiotica]
MDTSNEATSSESTPNLIDLDAEEKDTTTIPTISEDASTSQGKEAEAPTTPNLDSLHINESIGEPQNQSLPQKPLPSTPPLQPLTSAEKHYLDPTPKTPTISRHPSVRAGDEYNEKNPDYAQDQPDGALGVRGQKSKEDNDMESTSEIQSIMDQFDDASIAPSKEDIMSPRHEMAGPILGIGPHYPPRRSSLDHLRSRDLDLIASSPVASHSDKPLPSPPSGSLDDEKEALRSPSLKGTGAPSINSLPHQPPPPEPEPELPFDFHRFLEQLRHKSADPVAKFLRSFLTEFGKKQWMVHEQVKIIGDFLAFITNKMAICDVWREVSDNEFDNAKEGMEKLVMNRLYSQTFSPAIAPPPPQPARSRSRGRRKEQEKSLGIGRRGQHQEDVERDEILAQKIRIYSWIREAHLDLEPIGPNGERFLRLAQQELLKIKGYRAPRDKVICILNCCKVIFGLLKNAKSSDTSADSFVPLLIYVVLQANPENLVSNVQYILRFRNQDKLGGEAGYYLSSLSGAIQFIENLDRTTLTVSDEEFERNVELAVSEIAAQNREAEALSPRALYREKSSIAEPELTPRNSMDVTSTSPIRRDPSRMNNSTDGANDDGVTSILRSIQKPLSTIGRIFSDQDTSQSQEASATSTPTPQQGTRLLSPAVFQPPNEGRVPSYDAQEAAARQASAEAAEARRIQRQEHRTIVETLCGMFPNLDKEVIDDVVRQKEGRVGLAVDACLALTAGS